MTIRIISAGGLGDGLLLTPSFRSIKQRLPNVTTKVFCVNKGHFELFKHNPYIDVLRLATFWSAPVEYTRFRLNRSLFYMPFTGNFRLGLMGKHATQAIADVMGVKLMDNRLEVFLTTAEEAWARSLVGSYTNPVGIHITSSCSANQNWPTGRWELLVKSNPQYTFLQLGSRHELRIQGTIDLRGKTTVRQAIAILKYVNSFVGVVSFLAHATNAMGTPGVVIFGPSTPLVWGHSNNINLTANLRCAPCIDILLGAKCPYDAPCMTDIDVEDVRKALERQMLKTDLPKKLSKP